MNDITRTSKEKVSEERLRNTRAWAAARLGQMSGAEVIVGAIDELLQMREDWKTICEAADAMPAHEPSAAPALSFGQVVTDGQIVAVYVGEESAEFKLLRHNIWGVLFEVRREWKMRPTFRPATYDEMRSACPHDWLDAKFCDACRAAPPPVPEWQLIETASHENGSTCIVAVPNYNNKTIKNPPMLVGEAHYIYDEDALRGQGWFWAGEDPTDAHGPGNIYPTHWMPLPEAPCSTSTKGEKP